MGRGITEAEFRTIEGDIQSRETWVEALDGADYVFHFAAQTSTYVANQDPLADLNANVVPALQMLEACRQQGLRPRIMFSGTATQCGLPPQVPVDESLQDHPVVVYDIHKLMAEKYLQYYALEDQIPTVTLRLANVYGPGDSAGSLDRGVLNRMIRSALSNQPLTVYGEGAQLRDYVYIEDVVRGFLMAGAAAGRIAGNYYIIGNGTGYRIADAINLVADRVEHRLAYRPKVVHVPPPSTLSPIEERDFIADTARFRSATGWIPQVSLVDGIDRTLDYLQERNRTENGDLQ